MGIHQESETAPISSSKHVEIVLNLVDREWLLWQLVYSLFA